MLVFGCDGWFGFARSFTLVSPQNRNDDLRELFSKYGEVRDVYMPLDFHTRMPRGFAFVEFTSHEDARDAQEALDRYRMGDRDLTVLFAKVYIVPTHSRTP